MPNSFPKNCLWINQFSQIYDITIFSDILWIQKLKVPKFLKEVRDMPKFRSILYVPRCSGLDKIVKCEFELAEIGDKVLFENMGAYTSALTTDFNGNT